MARGDSVSSFFCGTDREENRAQRSGIADPWASGVEKAPNFSGTPRDSGLFHCCVSCYTAPVLKKNGTLENPVTCRAVHRQDAEEPFHELPESPDEGRSVYVVVFDAVGL